MSQSNRPTQSEEIHSSIIPRSVFEHLHSPRTFELLATLIDKIASRIVKAHQAMRRLSCRRPEDEGSLKFAVPVIGDQ